MLPIPARLAAACRGAPERRAWLDRLPDALLELRDRWSLSLGAPFDHDDVSCAWVAPARRADGTLAVLKLGMPHLEAAHELCGLRFRDGSPTVRLLEANEDLDAMLLEHCAPGTALRALPESEQDVIIAGLLHRLWRVPASPHPFRPLAVMTACWAEETRAASARWPADAGLIRDGLRLLEELPASSSDEVLLATDLHAGNILRARREPWLVIDPKPFVGDRTYDATQHLFNCRQRMRTDPLATIRRFADLLEVDQERVRLWMFARAAADPRDRWSGDSLAMARALV